MGIYRNDICPSRTLRGTPMQDDFGYYEDPNAVKEDEGPPVFDKARTEKLFD